MGKITGELQTLSEMISTYDKYQSMAPSVTEASKRTAITSRVYIEDIVVSDPIAETLLDATNQLYTAYVLYAVQISTLIQGHGVIRDTVDRFANEQYDSAEDIINQEFEGDFNLEIATEANVVELDKKLNSMVSPKVVDIDFATSEGGKVAVPFLMNILPKAISSQVAESFINLNFTPTLSMRWKQWKAGEIDTKDLVFSRDLVNNYADALRKDKNNALAEMIETRRNSKAKYAGSFFLRKMPKSNVASSVLIFDKLTFDRESSKRGFNIKKWFDRQEFFDMSFAVFICIVDTRYEKVTIYFNGLREYSEFTYKQLERKNGDGGNADMVKIFEQLQKGAAPTF